MATAKSTTPAQPGLGEAVEYRDARGNAKAALVIGTRKSLGIEDVPQEHKDILAKYGASLPSRRFSLDEGEVIVSVLSPSGKRYTRTVHFDADTKAWTSHTHND